MANWFESPGSYTVQQQRPALDQAAVARLFAKYATAGVMGIDGMLRFTADLGEGERGWIGSVGPVIVAAVSSFAHSLIRGPLRLNSSSDCSSIWAP